MKFLGFCGLLATVLLAGLAPQPAQAWQISQTEVLRYRVAWGPIGVGNASFAYSPTPSGYTIEVRLKDNSALVDLQSTYVVQGRHQPRPFTSALYHARQRENDYRADKVVRFDGAKRQIFYTNNLSAADTAPPLRWNGQMRDVFSQLYALRLTPVATLRQGQELQVMGTKRPFTLLQSAPTLLPAQAGQRPRYVVQLRSRKEDGTLAKDTWRVTLREEPDASFTPVRIEAQTKFGTFTATLR